MKPRELSTLDLIDLLDLAIMAEEEAAERYAEFADQMELHHNMPASRLFRGIHERELEHLGRLRDERRGRSDRPAAVQPLHFFDPVEAPSYERAHYKMTPRQILEVALEAERNAAAFYGSLVKNLRDDEARAVARACREEEIRHVEQVEEELRKLPPTSPTWEEDHDEPVPQA